jgi:hypothetical protein
MAKRVCRACGSAYDYPVRQSLSTRSHCEECAVIDVKLRRVLEKMSRRIERPAADVEALSRSRS